MNKRQLAALFVAGFAGYVVPAGTLPLLPVYAVELGAPPALTGYYLAFAYLALTAGTLAGGWLSDRGRSLVFAGRHRGHRQALLAMAGILAVPTTWAIGRSGSVWALILSTAGVWFLGGSGRTLISIQAGMLAGADERGKAYGLLSLAGGVGRLRSQWLVLRNRLSFVRDSTVNLPGTDQENSRGWDGFSERLEEVQRCQHVGSERRLAVLP